MTLHRARCALVLLSTLAIPAALFGDALAQDTGRAPRSDVLPRRGEPGWTLAGPAPGAQDVTIARVAQGSAAARAGLAAGDIVISVDGQAVASAQDRSRHLTRFVADRPVRLSVRRDGGIRELTMTPPPAPTERHPGRSLERGRVETRHGHRVRTWLTIPDGAEAPVPAVLVVKWLSCSPTELTSDDPDGTDTLLIRLIREMPVAVLRVDPPGQGDSEGPACIDVDFERELAAYQAAFAALRSDIRIDARRLYLLGLSNGGGIVPLVDPQGIARGIISSGGWMRGWYVHMVELEERRLRLSGETPQRVGELWRQLQQFHYHYLFDRLTPAQVGQRHPQLASVWYDQPQSQYGRPASFYHQLHDLDLRTAWSRVAVPTLVIHGGHDWIMSRADAVTIAELVNARRAGAATLIDVPRMSHGFELHDTPEEAFAGTDGVFAEAAWEALSAWLKERLTEDAAAVTAQAAQLDRARQAQANGAYDQARQLAEEALSMARETDDPAGAALAQMRLASIGIGARDLDLTLGHTQDALAHYEAVGDAVSAARAINLRAVAYDEAGNRREAEAGYRRYLETMQAHGTPEQVAWAQHNVGYFLWQKGELAAAERHMRAGLAYFEGEQVANGVSALARGLAAILRSAGDDAGALAASERALVATREGGSEEAMLMAFDKRVSALVLAGRTADAATPLAEGEALAGTGRWSRGHGDFALGQARYYIAAGDLARAETLTRDLVARFDAEGYQLNLAHALVLRAQTQRLRGQLDDAAESAARAQAIATALDTAEPRLQAMLIRALVLESEGDMDAASALRGQMDAQAEPLGLSIRLPAP